jgi:hypothetical protein
VDGFGCVHGAPPSRLRARREAGPERAAPLDLTFT